ncbi:MAG: MarR family transcriptional regulator [Acidimicrobiales bacterium]
MARGFTSGNDDDLIAAERDVQEAIGDLQIDFDSLAAVSNVFRVANLARYHMERTVLADHDLSFTAFTTLWVLWVWGEREARHLAAEAGITKGTLTGVVTTLERRGLVERRTHPNDKRLVLIAATDLGNATMADLFPTFNAEEARITDHLSTKQKKALASTLRSIVRTLEDRSDGAGG